MAFKVCLDANLLIDLTLKRSGYTAANGVIEKCIEGQIILYTTPAILHITAYYTAKYFTARQTKQILLTFLTNIQVIDCDHDTALSALLSVEIDETEDALQYYTALKHGVDYFISGDKKLKKAAIPQLPVYTAAELLAELAAP